MVHVFDNPSFLSLNQIYDRSRFCGWYEDTSNVRSGVLTYISDLFFLDCQLTAGMAILAVIKVMCPAQSVVSTVGIFYLSYIAWQWQMIVIIDVEPTSQLLPFSNSASWKLDF